MTEPTSDYERLDVYRLSIDYVAFSYPIARSLERVNRQDRDQLHLDAHDCTASIQSFSLGDFFPKPINRLGHPTQAYCCRLLN